MKHPLPLITSVFAQVKLYCGLTKLSVALYESEFNTFILLAVILYICIPRA